MYISELLFMLFYPDSTLFLKNRSILMIMILRISFIIKVLSLIVLYSYFQLNTSVHILNYCVEHEKVIMDN